MAQYPGRIEEKDGRTFQQHWHSGMRGRIIDDPCHQERVGMEIVAEGDHLLDHDFGPRVVIDGTAYHYWWGDVEVLR